MLSKIFGNRAFLKKVLVFAIPIILQNFITNFVSLLDNIMVGQVGTTQMSGVSVANQLFLVVNLCIFGVNAAAGIFTAQFHGAGNSQGVQHTVRFKLLVSTAMAFLAIGILSLGGKGLIGLYLQGEGDPNDAAMTLQYGRQYMAMMFWGLVPFALTNAYSSTMRECGESVVPMFSGIAAVIINLFLNYVLIFGHFGAPAMGVTGAALATVIARYAEFVIVAVWAHTHRQKYCFVTGLFRSLYVPGSLVRNITVKGIPLLANEFLWSSGLAVLAQCYSTCGLNVVPALNIAETINNLASVVAIAIANTVGILMGQMMGAGHPKQDILDANRKLLNVGLLLGVIFGGLLAAIALPFPLLYNTTQDIRQLASRMIFILAAGKPMMAYLMSVYFSLRSGGKTVMTFLYDCGSMWVFSIPLAYCLSRFAGLSILPLYAVCQSIDVLKAVIGYFIIRKGGWIVNLSAPEK